MSMRNTSLLRIMTFRFSFAIAALALATFAPAQGNNPFTPPRATLHYAPDRTFDLQHVSVELSVDYPNKTISGKSVNTLAPLRNGLTSIELMAGAGGTQKPAHTSARIE